MSSNQFYTPATLTFLRELTANNNRDWFAEHKPKYQEVVLEPSLRLIEAVGKLLERTAPMLQAEAKRQGGSLMRIYRDTRFSKDKTPLKTNIGIQFRHEVGKDVHAPGCYVHIQPDDSFIGVGIWRPESSVLKQIRQAIVDDSNTWKKIIKAKAFAAQFSLAGDSLKRPPQGIPADHPAMDDLKRKDFIAVNQLTEADILDPNLPKTINKHLKTAAPFMQFLCTSQGLLY